MPDVSPELAGKVLGADFRNLVKKVGEGSNLTSAEREMMESLLTGTAPPEELIKARLAALTRRWALGGKLNKDELREIGVPDAAKIMARQTIERYQRPLSHYATVYTRDVKNIKRWVASGRKCNPPDFPPFDEPARMADWFRRVMGQTPRENLTKFEVAAADQATEGQAPPSTRRDPPPSSQAAPAAADNGESALPPLPPMQIDMNDGASADLGLRQVQALVAATFKQMTLALERGRLTEFNQLRREWQQSCTLLRSWEKDIIKIQEGRGDVLRTRVINTEFVHILGVIGFSYFNGLQKLIGKLSPQMPKKEQRALALFYRDACFTHLKKTRWSECWQPDDSMPPIEEPS